MIHTTSIVKVDCVVRKTSAYRMEEFGRRRVMDLAGRPVWVVSPEDLVLSTLDWARDTRSEIQLRDVRSVLQACPDLDWDYLATAGIRAARPGLSDVDLRIALFDRFYGRDVSPADRLAVIARIRAGR